MHTRRIRAACVIGLLGVLFCPSTYAQEEYPGKRPQLEEVIVTAQKREQNLRDVPVAITALGRELLQNNEINNVQDLEKLVPSLKYTAKFDPGTSSIRVRGVGTELLAPTIEPNVSVVLDEVPLARTEMVNFEFADLERIEVLRGPQGTLFGKNSTAGVVHVITRDPSPELESFIRVNYEQPEDWPGYQAKTQFGFSTPITDSVGIRLTAFYKEIGGHLEDVVNNTHPPDSESWGARGKVRWEPSGTLNVALNVESQRIRGEPAPFVFRSANPGKAAREEEPVDFTEESRKAKTFGQDALDLDNDAIALALYWDLGAVSLTSVSAVREFDLFRRQSAPGLNGDRLDLLFADAYRTYTTFSQELRLTSNDSDTLEYTVGALWFSNELKSTLHTPVDDIPPALAAQGSGLEDLLLQLGALPGNSDALFQEPFFSGEALTENIGVFGQLTWHMSDRWHLTAGIRYIYDKQTADAFRTSETRHSASGAVISEEFVDPLEKSIQDSHVIGTLSQLFNWTEDTNIYATISTGYRGGAIDIQSEDLDKAFSDPVKPETSFNIEVGSKSRLFDNRLELNIAVFDTIFRDFQAQVVEVAGEQLTIGVPAAFKTDNAGELETLGVELEFKAQLTERLYLSGAMLYNKAEFNEFNSQCFIGQQPGESGGVDENGDGICDVQDAAGGVLPNAPEFSGSVTGRYETPINRKYDLLYVQITGRWQDDVQFDAAQQPNAIQEAYSIWDMRVGWRGFSDRMDIGAYVTNVFDQFYVSGMFPFSLENDRRDMVHFVPRDASRQLGVSMGFMW